MTHSYTVSGETDSAVFSAQ